MHSGLHALLCGIALVGGVDALCLGGGPRGIDCETVSCDHSGYDTKTYWDCKQKEGSVTPDRRPVKLIPLLDRSCSSKTYPFCVIPEMNNCADVSPANSIPDGFDWLLGFLQSYYDVGWRRFIILLPAGAHDGDGYFPASQWWTLPDWMRDGYASYIGGWLKEHEGATLGIYAGWKIHDPCRLCNDSNDDGCMKGDDPVVPECENSDHASIMQANIYPWYLDVGISEYWFDAASEYPTEYLALRNSGFFPIPLGMEAVPTILQTTYDDPDMSVIDQTPVDMTSDFLFSHWKLMGMGHPRPFPTAADINAASNWDFSGLTGSTEVHIHLDQQFYWDPTSMVAQLTPTEVLAVTKAYYLKGFIPWVGATDHVVGMTTTVFPFEEATIRLHWPGAWGGSLDLFDLGLSCPYDLNMDGVVNSTDLGIVTANTDANPGKRLYQGDVDGDGYVTSSDAILLMLNYGACP